jgi:hypothetical protein
MKLIVLIVAVVVAVLFLVIGNGYAANGDLIVNGNLGVGTTTPQGKVEVNGNMIVDGNLGVGTTTPSEKAEVNGNLKVNGNLCVGGNCTNSLQVSGGLYGWCSKIQLSCVEAKSPASCVPTGYGTIMACSCPSGYTTVQVGIVGVVNGGATGVLYSCYKN